MNRDGNIVYYIGLEPVSLNGSAPTVIFDGDEGGDNWVIENHAVAGRVQVRSVTGDIETTDFGNPAVGLQVNLGDGDNSVTITELDPSFVATINVTAGDGADVVDLTALDLTLATTIILDLGSGENTLRPFAGGTFALTSSDTGTLTQGAVTVKFVVQRISLALK